MYNESSWVGWTPTVTSARRRSSIWRGGWLGTASFAVTREGYGQLLGWLRSLGGVECVGAEGISSYGAGLARRLAAEGVSVVEVLRPKRGARRGDKSDPADAEAAARVVLSGEATARPEVR